MVLLKTFELQISFVSQTDSSHQKRQKKTKDIDYIAHLSNNVREFLNIHLFLFLKKLFETGCKYSRNMLIMIFIQI